MSSGGKNEKVFVGNENIKRGLAKNYAAANSGAPIPTLIF
jgi:hypothetical protein